MIFLLLSVSASLGIGMIFKHTGRQGVDRMVLLTANYAAAMLAGFASVAVRGMDGGGALSPGLLALAGTSGVFFIGGFFLLSLATEVAGMSLAIGVMRVSVVIPFLASWIVWAEVPTPAQGGGLVLAAAAFFLIARREAPATGVPAAGVPAAGAPHGERKAARAFPVLALLFVVGGLIDTFMKAFDEGFAAETSRSLFLAIVFGAAFGVGLMVVVHRTRRAGTRPSRRAIDPGAIGWGVLLGVANYASAEFFLLAVDRLSGPFVFPANNIAIVIGGALLGVAFWKEHLSRLNWAGLGLAAVALLLLNL